MNKYKLSIIAIILFCITITGNQETVDYHVICSLSKNIKSKLSHKLLNHKIHEATYEIRQFCKKLSKKEMGYNQYYPRKKDKVFFVHFNHNFYTWTLYKPSYLDYEQFVKIIKKIYAKHGLQVDCQKDYTVTINHNHGLNNKYLTLAELERYKKMSDEQFKKEIESFNEKSSDNQDKIENLRNAQEMQKFLFWHLQIPTTGLYNNTKLDISDQYKPLAWHYTLWDLAPKKGKGAQVAIIDTGACAFHLEEKEFAEKYKKNINLTAPCDLLDRYGYNLVSENGLDPIRQIAINFGNYCNHEKFDSDLLMKKLPDWIINFLETKNDSQIREYFIKNAKNQYLDKTYQDLNEMGEKALKDLLYGPSGIIQSDNEFFFHIGHIKDPCHEKVLVETLPAPSVIDSQDPFAAGHGTFTQGIVNAQMYEEKGITGLAPQAKVVMIKAFNDKGTTNKTTLTAALQRAINLKNPIVSMSLKITDEFNPVVDRPLKELVDSIDYVVAASGNDGSLKKLQNKEAYPAKFDSVAFDVGAFAYDDQYSICDFTQKEKNIGPKFVAPGKNILSSGITPNQNDDSMYVFMSGTSIAVPIITGFMALVAAEFEDQLTREQILKVIYTFSMKLHDDQTWQEDILLGTPDMRSSLLCLHVLVALKKLLKNNKNFCFESYFDNLVQAIYTINYYIPMSFEKEIGYSFVNKYTNYAKIASGKSISNNSCSLLSGSLNVSDTIENVATIIEKAINKSTEIKELPLDLSKTLQKILYQKNFKLFAHFSKLIQKRIYSALQPRFSCEVK
ncbi:MAG: S8 family peptidase [Candidatus Chromulinivorax sp.]